MKLFKRSIGASKLNSIQLGVTFALAVSFGASQAVGNVLYDYGDVVDVSPMMKVVRVAEPRQECWQERVVHHRPVRTRGQSQTNAIIGGIIGAAVGNHVGHSKTNKKVGALAGAILGSSIGRDSSQKHHAPRQAHARYEQRCRTVNDYYEQEQMNGYRVVYRYNDKTYTTRTVDHPGKQIKLQLQISPVSF